MTSADKLIIFDFDFTVADTINEFNPFVCTWEPLPGAKKLAHYFEKFPDHTYILTARYEHFEGRSLINKFLPRIGLEGFPPEHIIFAGFLKNFHRKKASIIRALIQELRPKKIIVFDDTKANRTFMELVEDEFRGLNIIVVDPVTGDAAGRTTPDIED